MRYPLIVAVIVFALDQITKFLITVFIPQGYQINILPFFNFFNINHVRNTGAAFSMFEGINGVFIILISIFLSTLLVFLYKLKNNISKIQMYAYWLIFAGGLGNFSDRIFRGAVVDFLDFGINNVRWPSFNIADSCICIAAGLVIWDILFNKKHC
jgi:signal peptidase II